MTVYELHRETMDDHWEVEALFDLCFAPGREALSSYKLRANVDPVSKLCLVARDNSGVLAGAVRHWPVRIEASRAILLGPIAVHPTRQGEGLGAYMIAESQRRALDLGWERMLLVGDSSYYGRFGFSRVDGIELPPPTNPERVLGFDLAVDAWKGICGRVAVDT